MAVLIRNSHVFFHIPKTGGKFIDSILLKNNLYSLRLGHRHSNYSHIQGIINRKVIKFRNKIGAISEIKLSHPLKFFCVIRDPISWYESWYKYNKKKNFTSGRKKGDYFDWHIMSPVSECNDNDFNIYMNNINKNYPGFATYVFNSYLIDLNIEVIRFENIRDDLKKYMTFNKLPSNFIEDHPITNSTLNEEKIFWDDKVKKETLENEKHFVKKYYNNFY